MRTILCVILLIVYTCIPIWSLGEDDEIHTLLTAFYEEGFTLPSGIAESDLYCAEGVLFGKNTLLLYPEWKEDTLYMIPDGTETVFDFAFCGNEFIKSVTIPSSCVILGYRSFGDCFSLNEITLTEDSQLIVINDYCFCGCHSLKRFDFPLSLYIIGEEAFAETGLSEIYIPGNVKLICNYAFVKTSIDKNHLRTSCRS